MKENKFDDLIKNRLENYKSSVPENMWERIAGNKKEDKGIFLIRKRFLITALLLIGFANFYYFIYIYNKSGNSVVINKSFINKKIDKKEISNFLKEENISTNNLDPVKKGKSEKSDNVIKNNNQLKKYLFVKNKKEKQKEYRQLQFVKSGNRPVENITSLDEINKISGDENKITDSLLNKPAVVNKAVKSDSSDNSSDKKEEIKDRFLIELYTSPDLAINEISAENKAYEQILKNIGTRQFSYTFGARMNYEITKKIFVKFGVQYARVNEKISFFDSVQADNVTATNYYKNISVPLILSYKINGTRNLNFSLNTGIILNIASKFKGVIPSVSGVQVDLETNKVYNKKPSTILYLSFDISKRISGRSEFFAEPWFNYRLKNMTNNYYLFNQKIHTSGLSLGLRYQLFKK